MAVRTDRSKPKKRKTVHKIPRAVKERERKLIEKRRKQMKNKSKK